MGITDQLREMIRKQIASSGKHPTTVYLGCKEWEELLYTKTTLPPCAVEKNLFMGLTVHQVQEDSHIGIY